MKLKSLKLRNFRGYKDLINVNFEDITAFIGKNDAGKSTILEALEIFFNNSLIVCEKEDLNVDAEDDLIEISCVFTNLPERITIDTTSETTLQDEYLLNQDGDLEIKKIFKATVLKPKPNVYIICNHPTNEPFNNLLSLKKQELKKLAESLKIDSNLYKANNNASMRNAIWNNTNELNLQMTELAVDKEDSKKIYDSLEKFLPIYSLFQSDRPSTDNDKEVTDPMGLAVKEALRDLEEETDKIKQEVMKKAIDTANRTLKKLKEMDTDLASTLSPDFKAEPKFDSLFKLTIKSDDGISINKRGSGVRRLILLNFFRAEAERKLQESSTKSIIYAFEEPETSQHPKHQEMLVNSFLQLALNTNSQVILTTHTPALAGLIPLESLRFITEMDGKKIIKYDTESVFEEISDTLGILSDSISKDTKAILLLEGQADIIFIRHLCNKLKAAGEIPATLEEKGFALLPTGGIGNLKAWKTLKIAEQFNVPWCVFIDSDKGTIEGERNIKMLKRLKEDGIKAYMTRKRELENYIHTDCFDTQITFNDYDDAKAIINQHTRVKKDKVLENFWCKMTFEQIREIETYEDEDGKQRFEFTEMILDFLTLV